MNISEEKTLLRKELLKIRGKIADKREKSFAITNIFIDSDLYKNAESIMLFYPLADEVNTLFLFERLLKDEKTVLFPKTDKASHTIIPEVYEGYGFKQGAYGIYEPLFGKKYEKENIDAVIVPALSVDRDKYRLGYGGGYYDRFLEDFRGVKITLIFSELLSVRLPRGKFDIKTDNVITEKGFFSSEGR